MLNSRTKLIGIALSALGATSCVFFNTDDNTHEQKPFIEPLILSQSQCSGGPKKTTQTAQDTSLETSISFDFAKPFPLPDDIVDIFHYPISTSNKDAQHWFDTGLAHMANFNHDEAIAAFRKAQEIDANCAMCFWGEGLSFGSNINAPFDAKRGAAGLIAVQKAQTLANSASNREAALIGALATRYSKLEDGKTVENAETYAKAMHTVAQDYADDKTILTLAAEANMDTQPWDYWEAGARTPKGRTAQTLELLETALSIDPEFAPSIHLYIHTTEASVNPFRAEKYADTLAQQNLGVGHLVHMPSHTYLRLGHWKKSNDANIDAIAADEAYIANSKNGMAYAQSYYPHNVHFLVANAQLGGDASTALQMADKLKQLVKLDPDTLSPFGEHIAAAPIFTALQFDDSDAVLIVEKPADAQLYLLTAWHYARGTSLLRQGDKTAAKAELAALSNLTDKPQIADYEAFGLPMSGVIEVARLTLAGRISASDGDLTKAINKLDEAADIHDQLSYMEPTWWHYPTRQTLGAMLIQDGQFDRAEREFYRTLIKSPNNAYALYGLAEAFKAQGDTISETYARHLFDDAWIGETGKTPDISDL